MKGQLGLAFGLALMACAPAFAQDAATPAVTSGAAGRQSYLPADFAQFAPRTARDMLAQVPGFTLRSEDQARGLGAASANVLINGERVTTKSDGVDAQLGRISIARVVRIEIVDGATLGIPGLSGQVANVITKAAAISGRFEYDASDRPRFAKPSWIGGEISVSGSKAQLEWTLAMNNGVGRGAAGGPSYIFDAAGRVTDSRTVVVHNESDNPGLVGKLKWAGTSGTVANINGRYTKNYSDNTNDEDRAPVGGVARFRDFDARYRGYNYEVGADLDLKLGVGRLKLIGLDRVTHGDAPSSSTLFFADHSPSTGSRFAPISDNAERIGRAEYRWDMLGGTWRLDGEAAYNSFDQTAHLFSLNPSGALVEVPFPTGSGGVTEDRYESVLTHNRSLGKGLTLQVGAGVEYSKLSQTGSGGLERQFTRPKGSLNLAWTLAPGTDVSFKLARSVGQLSFSDFLANVNLAQNTGNAGNVLLVPPQTWEASLEYKRNLKALGSASVKVFGRRIDDYIDIIPVGASESRGNVDRASQVGVSGLATINLDPVGWKGAKINVSAVAQSSTLNDPLTGRDRPFSGEQDATGSVSLRYDVPKSDWAMGGGFQWSHVKPQVRLFEIDTNFEGPIYSFAFIENKNVHGLTVNLNVFNLTQGRLFLDRTVWTGLRDRSPVAFREKQRLDISTIYRIQVKGNF